MHILVVDDDAAVRLLVTKAVAAHGHTVVACASGTEGVSRLCDASPEVDAVVLDLVMPTMDGWATFRAMRALAPMLPIVLVSGFDAVGVAGLLSEPAVAFLPKPFAVDALVRALDAVTAKATGADPAGGRREG